MLVAGCFSSICHCLCMQVMHIAAVSEIIKSADSPRLQTLHVNFSSPSSHIIMMCCEPIQRIFNPAEYLNLQGLVCLVYAFALSQIL